MHGLIRKAKEFATHYHFGQTRKYTGEPYIVHPEEVARLVESTGASVEQIAAAWLHDTVEDCNVTLGEIKHHFGWKVEELVRWVTDVSRPEHGNREHRKFLDRMHLSRAPDEAQTIKLADLISNTRSIVAHDPQFAITYLAEKRKLLEVMLGGDPDLRRQAWIQWSTSVIPSGNIPEDFDLPFTG